MKGSFVSTNFQYFYLIISKIRIFARHYFTFFIKDIPYWRIKCPAQNSKNKTGISTPYTANLIYLKKKYRVPGYTGTAVSVPVCLNLLSDMSVPMGVGVH